MGLIRNEAASAGLDAAFLARTATVVRDGGHFLDQFHVQASSLQGGDGTFATGSRSFDANFNVTHTKLGCFFSSLLSSTLTSERRAFTAALESTGSCTGPAQRVTLGVRDGHRGVVESRVNVSNTVAYVSADAFFLVGLCHRNFSNRSMNGGRKEIGIKANLRLSQILDALLTSDRLTRPFAGPCIGLGALPTNGQADTVPDAAVGFDLPHAADVLSHLTTQRTFDEIISFEKGGDATYIFIADVAGG